MKLLQLPPAQLRASLRDTGIWLRTGPFSLQIRSRVPSVAEGLAELYGQFEVRHPRETFADFQRRFGLQPAAAQNLPAGGLSGPSHGQRRLARLLVGLLPLPVKLGCQHLPPRSDLAFRLGPQPPDAGVGLAAQGGLQFVLTHRNLV